MGDIRRDFRLLHCISRGTAASTRGRFAGETHRRYREVSIAAISRRLADFRSARCFRSLGFS